MTKLFQHNLLCGFIYFLFLAFATSSAFAQELSSKVNRIPVKGNPKVKLFKPQLLKTNAGQYKAVIKGKAEAGSLISMEGRRPHVVPPNGNFEMVLDLSATENIHELQFVNDRGEALITVYEFDVLMPAETLSERELREALVSGKLFPGEKEAETLDTKDFQLKELSQEWSLRMKFDPQKNGVQMSDPKFDYSIFTTSDVRIGNYVLRHNNVMATVDRIEGDEVFVSFSWSRVLVSSGHLHLKNKKGDSVWKTSIDKTGTEELAKERTTTKLIRDMKAIKQVEEFSIEELNEYANEPVQFCAISDAKLEASFCSPFLRWDARQRSLEIVRPDTPAALVSFNGKKMPHSGSIQLNSKNKINKFKMLTPLGHTYEFSVDTDEFNLIDVIQSADNTKVYLTGRGRAPNVLGVKLLPDDEWVVSLPRKEATLYFFSTNGISLRQDFIFPNRLPLERYRPWLHANTPESSYVSEVSTRGQAKSPAKYVAPDNRATNTAPNAFDWDFSLEERGYVNKSYLGVNTKSGAFNAYHEMYKGYPFEISGRLTGIMSQGQSFWFLNEVAFGAWAENFFGYRNYYLTDRRWGVNFKYIKSLSVGGTDPELTTMHLDLKYRFTPGLWNKDESVGAILGYQDLEYRGMASPQTGVGLFWARKMPKIFDDVLNLFSFLRYPKWVDMEGIYYFNSMNSKTQLHGPNYIVTFHGKMFLKPVLFMEGSIGLRGFAITDKSAGRKSNVNMMFTTIGLGLNF